MAFDKARHTIRRRWTLVLALAGALIASLSPAPAKRYPNPRDEEYSFHSICELLYTSTKRVPVYRNPSEIEPPVFYMPRNYGVCISGAYKGWGLFGRIREAAFFRAFWEMIPDQGIDYGWIRLSELQPGRGDEGCTLHRTTGSEDRFEFPNAKAEDAGDICPIGFETIDDANAVVLFWQRRFAGQSHRSFTRSSLNKCAKTCRDDAACKGFSYSASESRCDLKSGGGIDFEAPAAGSDNFAGVKLAD